jgi:hypothetical protein
MRQGGSVYACQDAFSAELRGSVYAWITWVVHRVTSLTRAGPAWVMGYPTSSEYGSDWASTPGR